jgi:hypothetical protein
MSEYKIDVTQYAGIDRDGRLVMITELINSDTVFEEHLDLDAVLMDLPGYHLCRKPVGFKTQKARREVEITINNFERAAARAIRDARKELSRYKTYRQLAQTESSGGEP